MMDRKQFVQAIENLIDDLDRHFPWDSVLSKEYNWDNEDERYTDKYYDEFYEEYIKPIVKAKKK